MCISAVNILHVKFTYTERNLLSLLQGTTLVNKVRLGLKINALPLPFIAVCKVYPAVNILNVSAEPLVETYLQFLAVTNCVTCSELRLPCETHESDG